MFLFSIKTAQHNLKCYNHTNPIERLEEAALLTGINIADYLAKIEDSISRDRFYYEIMALARELASELKREISRKETLATVKGQVPLLESYSFECQMWALSILMSAWSVWIFTAKSNDPIYQTQKKEASANARIVRSYVAKTVTLAWEAGNEIGSCSENKYRPEGIAKFIQIEKWL